MNVATDKKMQEHNANSAQSSVRSSPTGEGVRKMNVSQRQFFTSLDHLNCLYASARSPGSKMEKQN